MNFTQQLLKSRACNMQLQFIDCFTLSYVHNNQPESLLIKCRQIDQQLIIYMDARSKTYQQLSTEVAILWHFPLSKEIYQIKGTQLTVDNVLEHWEKVDKEERKTFHSKTPDSVLDQVAEKQLTDVDKFNMQDKQELSTNFRVIAISPYEVTLTRETMPQVVADSRTKFESIFRPYKEVQKIHYQLQGGQWVQKLII